MLGIRSLRSSTSTASRSMSMKPLSLSNPKCCRNLSISSVQLAEEKVKVPVTLIASLRKLHPVPIASARDALSRSNLDLQKAIDYLQSSSSSNASAEKKAAKVSGRSTNEGVISLSLLGSKRVGMIHLACETDFVARNDVFLNTAKGVAETTAFLDVPGENDTPTITADSSTDPILSFPTESLLSAPLISISNSGSDPSAPLPTHAHDPLTIRQTLLSSLSQTGENLQLLRAVSFAAPFPSSPNVRFVPGAYAHGGPSDKQGKVGGIVILSITSRDTEKPIATLIHSAGGDVLEEDLNSLARTVARQVVGFPTKAIEKSDVGLQDEEVLVEQPFMMFQGDSRKVKDVLEEWGKERGVNVRVVGLRRWAVGDEL